MKHLNIRSSYSVYSNISEDPIDIKIYMLIVKGYLKFLIQRLFDKGEISIPEKLGKLQVIGKKVKVRIEDGVIKGLAPDWVKTKELWKQDPEAKDRKQLVYHFNEDSNGIRYKFHWSTNRVLVANKTLYSLRLTRTNKRDLSNKIKQGKEYLIK